VLTNDEAGVLLLPDVGINSAGLLSFDDGPFIILQLAGTATNGVAFIECDALCVVGRLVSRKSLCRVGPCYCVCIRCCRRGASRIVDCPSYSICDEKG
jgi:hypothetical protein